MRLWIPKCGDAIRLEKQWTFMLHDESRNDKMRSVLGLPGTTDYRRQLPPEPASFDAGTELVVDRVYIRQDADDFASVTFVVKDGAPEPTIGERFWVKLEDANSIEATFVSADNPVGFGARAYKTAAKAKVDPSVLEKAKRRKEAKAEVESVRDQLVEELKIASWNAKQAHFKQHMEEMVELATLRFAERNKARPGGPWFNNIDRLRWKEGLSRDLLSQGDWNRWSCLRSKRQPDGSVVRTFVPGGAWFDKADGGFDVTSRDGVVTFIVPA